MATQRLVLIDGSSMIFRAYYAIPSNLRTRGGLPTNAIYGFTTMFNKLLSGRTPDMAAVLFDPPGRSFRAEQYPEYKAHRPRMADDLVQQLEWIDKVVECHNFPILRVEGYEADDVIGTLSKMAVEAGNEVVIVSADKDFAQLIGDQVKMYDAIRDLTYDAELVRKKWGVPPDKFVDYLALIGDSVDNIPGVPGVGGKTAASLLEQYGDLETILSSTSELKGRARTALEEHADQARLSRELATIDCGVPLTLTLQDLAFTPPDARRLNELYRELEFFSLLSDGAKEEQARREEGNVTYRLVSDPEELRRLLEERYTTPVAVTPIYDLPTPVRGTWVGTAFSTEPEDGFFAPHGCMQVVAEFLADPARPKVVHDLKELVVLAQKHGLAVQGVVGDTRLASFLVEPSRAVPHDLDRVAKEYLQRVLRPLKSVVGSGQKQKAFSELELEAVADYACHLADAVGQVWPVLRDLLEEAGQREQLTERDLPLSMVLAQMELDGIRVDQNDLAAMGTEFKNQLGTLESTIHEMAGHAFNIDSPKQLATVLFEELGLPVIKRTKTGYSTNAEVLERLAPKHEIAAHVLDYRRLAKLINTYVDVLQREVNPETGRIHTTFQMTAGVTGRLITTDPDLQRTPVKTPEGRRIRRAFIPRDGWKLVSADWSQIELRVLAHFSGDPLLVDSFGQGLDVHRRTAGELFGCAPEEVTREQREVAKTVNFATIYGQGATALAQILSVPRKEAEQYIEGYFRAYRGVRAWLDETVSAAYADGYVTTLFGRRRFIAELSSRNPMDRMAGERIAANTPIQGSAADICKEAMLRIWNDLSGLQARMLLQVHDELVFEAPPEEVPGLVQMVKSHMEHAVVLDVPLVAEVGVGDNWSEAH